jgi:hypothetical protein
MPRFSYSNAQLNAGIQSIISKIQTSTSQKVFVGSEQALRWIQDYPPKIIDESLGITSSWFTKNLNAGKSLSETDFVRYATAVMRNRDADQQKVKELKREAQKAKWDALAKEEQEQYPGGFDDWVVDE